MADKLPLSGRHETTTTFIELVERLAPGRGAGGTSRSLGRKGRYSVSRPFQNQVQGYFVLGRQRRENLYGPGARRRYEQVGSSSRIFRAVDAGRFCVHSGPGIESN